MWRHYVYLHTRNDTGEVFYVGKGSLRPRQKTQRCERATAMDRRNPRWLRIVGKHGFMAIVFASCESDEDAQELERSLIASYGRLDTRTGCLVNLTDGGEGHAGIVLSDARRKHLSDLAKRPRTEAWVKSIRIARHKGGNGGVVKLGDKLPPSWRSSIAAAKRGARNPMFGKRGELHPMRRAVVDSKTGVEYPTTTAAAAAIGMRMQSLHNMLTGFRKNKTTLRFAP